MKLKEKSIVKRIIPTVLLIAAVISYAYGIYSGEVNTVFRKAVNICLECIGIG